MRNPVKGTRFRNDLRLAEKRGKDMAKLRGVSLLLIEGSPLRPRHQDHPLAADWKHCRDLSLLRAGNEHPLVNARLAISGIVGEWRRSSDRNCSTVAIVSA